MILVSAQDVITFHDRIFGTSHIGKVEALSNIFIPNGKKAALSGLPLTLRSVNASNLHLLAHLTEPILTRTDGQFRPNSLDTFIYRVFMCVLNEKKD